MIQFFIRCEPHSPYFYAVEVHDNEAKMVAAIGELRGKVMKSDTEIRAVCLRYVAEGRDEYNKLVKTGELGTLFFHCDDIPFGVVLHETTHAAIGWARRARVNPTSKHGEERFTVVAQTLFEQVQLKLQQSLVWRAAA